MMNTANENPSVELLLNKIAKPQGFGALHHLIIISVDFVSAENFVDVADQIVAVAVSDHFVDWVVVDLAD